MVLIKILWTYWKKIAFAIGILQTRTILTLIYFTLMLPMGIIFGFRKDILGLKRKTSLWTGSPAENQTLEEMQRQS